MAQAAVFRFGSIRKIHDTVAKPGSTSQRQPMGGIGAGNEGNGDGAGYQEMPAAAAEGP